MSASQTPPEQAGAGAADPSMEDILASIRRILSEEEAPATAQPASTTEPAAALEKSDDVLVLDTSMLVPGETAEAEAEAETEAEAAEAEAEGEEAEPEVMPAPGAVSEPLPLAERLIPPADVLLAPETEAAASSSVGNLMRTLATERTLRVHRGGPTVEDIVREELRPLLKQWLDANLPGLVERLVRTEIERVVHGAVP